MFSDFKLQYKTISKKQTHRPMKQNEELSNNPCVYGQLIYTKELKIYNRKGRNSVGKTGQICEK